MSKKIGIIGGIGWPSSIEYYRLICEASQQYHSGMAIEGPTPMPEMVIESLNMNFTVNNRGSSAPGSWDQWDRYFQDAIARLERSGAELILLASVTPHARLAQITANTSLPVVNYYQALGDYCRSKNIEQMLVLGTMPTMTTAAFKIGLQAFGVEAQYPPNDGVKQQLVTIIDALYQNKTQGAASAIEDIVSLCISPEQRHNTAICLACTELPLAFENSANEAQFDVGELRYLNSTVIHAAAAFQACIA